MNDRDDHPTEAWLTAEECARRLGVSAATVRRWAQEGRLPAARFGPRALRVRERDLEEFIAAAREAAKEE